jgi:hypothetical protein
VHDVLAKFEGLTRAPKAYTSVQCGRGPDDHMELNSDLVYSAYALFILFFRRPLSTPFQSTTLVKLMWLLIFLRMTVPNGMFGR